MDEQTRIDRIFIGHSSAYAYAKSKGYEGTEDEFAQLCADLGIQVEYLEDMAVVTNTLEPGTPASATYEDGVLTLNIPKGEKGDPAPADEVAEATDAWLAQNITNPSNPPLDRSLALANAAAPADMVGDLRSAFIDGVIVTTPFGASKWAQGTINSTTGTDGISSSTIRTGYITAGELYAVETLTGYTFLIFGFDTSKGYLGYWRNGAWSKSSGAPSYYVTSADLLPLITAGAVYIRIAVKKSDGTDLLPGEGVNCVGQYYLPSNNKKEIEEIKTRLTADEEDIDELSEAITETEGLPEAFKRLAWSNKPVSYTAGGYIDVSGEIGSNIDVEDIKSSGTLCYAISPCYKGDKFVVTGSVSGLTKPRAWAFLDTYYNLLSRPSSATAVDALELTAQEDGYFIAESVASRTHSLTRYYYYEDVGTKVDNLESDVSVIENELRDTLSNNELTDLVSAQKSISEDWHFSFINVFQNMGLGNNHIIPGTATTWNPSGTSDLTQKNVWMSDGVHPFKGDGVTDMYARTIANQLALVTPSYKDGVGETTPTYWVGRKIMWMGTSIPAGSDPDAGSGTGSTYPTLVAEQLSATSINVSRGSSCVRINASTGVYSGMVFSHFIRALTRTIAECDVIAENWDDIKDLISLAPDELTESNVTTMKNHSFENLILPRLDGTLDMPDLFVIDHGHNDVRPKGIDGKNDLWVEPTLENIESGILAEDTYMTENDYANLKLALNDNLTGISDLAAFSASLNRNCFKGAVNFLITVILRYNPYARIAIVSDYN